MAGASQSGLWREPSMSADMTSVRFIRQENRSSGCGPACIAMVAGTRLPRSQKRAYEKAVSLIFSDGRTIRLQTKWHHLRAALNKLDIAHADRIHRHRSWAGISTLSIVKCGQYGKDGENWHWVVYDGRTGLLYDPLRDGPVVPKGNMRIPRSHLPIYV